MVDVWPLMDIDTDCRVKPCVGALLDRAPVVGTMVVPLGRAVFGRIWRDFFVAPPALAVLSEEWRLLEFLAGVYATSGQPDKAREVLAAFLELSEQQYVCAYEVATAQAALGDHDEALEWFEKGIEDRADCMPYARADPKWDDIRDEPRFQELLQRIGPGG